MEDTIWNPSQAKWRVRRFELLILCVGLCNIVCVFGVPLMMFGDVSAFIPQFYIEHLVAFQVPGTANDVRWKYVWGMQGADIVWLRFDLPAPDFSGFQIRLESLCFEDEGYSTDQSEYQARGLREYCNPFIDSGSHPDWWTTEMTGAYQGMDCEVRDRDYQILIDQTNPDVYRVFMRAFVG